MKVKITRVTDIIKLSDESAFLENISDDGKSYIYKISYQADPQKVINNKAINVKIRFLKDETQQKNIHVFTTGLPFEQLTDNLLSHKSSQKDLARSKTYNIILESSSDISKKIPNSEIKNISIGTNKKPVKKIVNSVNKAGDIKKQNKIQPVLEQNLSAFKESIGINLKQFMDRMVQVRKNFKTDPAVFLGSKTNTIIPANKGLSGIKSKNPVVNRNINVNNKNISLIKENLLSITNITNSSQLSSDEHVNISEISYDSFINISEYIQLPISLFQDPTFIIEFEIYNNKGISQQIISTRVDHKTNLDNLLVPINAPTIISSPIQKPGKTILFLKQNDKLSNKVNIYKKTYPNDTQNTDSNFIFVKSIPLEYTDNLTPFVDEHASVNQTIYRAVAVSKNNVLGFDFNSVVVESNNKLLKTKRGMDKKDSSLTLTHQITNSTIKLFINNISSGPIALQVFKKDLTTKEVNPKNITEIIHLNSDNNQGLVFEDFSVKKNRIYEYYCKLTYKNGTTEIAKNNLIVKYEPINTNITSITVTTPVVLPNELDVQFTIQQQNILQDIDIVKKVLGNQNILTEYSTEILNEKEKLQKLFFTRVLRTNMTTGEIEDFGIIDDLSFSDAKYGKLNNVSTIEVGTVYTYTIMTYAVAAEVLFQKYYRTVTNSNGTTYLINPYKWLHPYTLSEGTITTPATLKTRHANSSFTFGDIVDITYVSVDLTDILPYVTDVQSTVIGSSKVLTKWKINGNAKLIDHFIIILKSMGSRTIVGKSHNISSTNDFEFVDLLDNNEHGALNYIIIPIYFDYRQGTEVSSKTIFI